MNNRSPIARRFWSTIREKINACGDGRMMVHGWHLCGAGSAQYGWAWVFPTGAKSWMGCTMVDVLERIETERSLRALEVTQ